MTGGKDVLVSQIKTNDAPRQSPRAEEHSAAWLSARPVSSGNHLHYWNGGTCMLCGKHFWRWDRTGKAVVDPKLCEPTAATLRW